MSHCPERTADFVSLISSQLPRCPPGRAHLPSAIILCPRLCHPAFLTLLSLLTEHILYPAAGLSSDPASSEGLPRDAPTSAQAQAPVFTFTDVPGPSSYNYVFLLDCTPAELRQLCQMNE